MKKQIKDRITSLDGKKTITASEFERLFNEGSDEIDDFIDWSTIEISAPHRKQPVTLRLDADVLAWFKSSGRGYQTRMNAVLRRYKETREQGEVAA
jgi:uncharacterized protein (DUF4415 family)